MKSRWALEFPYQDKAFQSSWHQHLAAKFKAKDLKPNFVVLNRNRFMGIPLFKQLRIPGWNSAWAQDFTDGYANQLLNLKRGCWSALTFEWAASRKELLATPLLAEKGYPVLSFPVDKFYIADTSQGWEAYCASHSKSRQKDIAYRLRQAERNKAELVWFEGQAGVDEFFSLYLPAHLSYWGRQPGGSYFADEREQRFFIDWCKGLEQDGKLVLLGLKLNDELSYLTMGIQQSPDTFLGVLSITTGCQKKLAPGIIAVYMQIRRACEKGMKVFNMGTGYYPFKAQASTYTEPCYRTIVINPASLRGRLYQGYILLKQWKDKQKPPSEQLADSEDNKP
jgi:hypothetical protein